MTATSFEVSEEVYPIGAIYRACYSFTDRAYLFLEPGTQPKTIRISVTSKDGTSVDKLHGELENALLDFSVRSTIAKETSDIRAALIREALPGAMTR